jgi:oxygen-independent coproporphyrinogen-3 oxidase
LEKCPYCDFNSHKTPREAVPHEAYADAVLRELEARSPELEGRTLSTVFFGGGTPSLWSKPALGRVLAGIRSAFGSEVADLEVSVECNPTSLDQRGAAELREVGVNRLSIGVQSLSSERLKFLGRLHDAGGALRAIEEAQREIDRVSADLIFGVATQKPEDARRDVEQILETGVRHVSAYALTIEQGTRFGELHKKGKLPLAPEDHVADGYLAVEETLTNAGFGHYEVSNYAVPGQEARHNLHYWSGGSYLGLGAGAVGCLDSADGTASRWRDEPLPARYLDRAGGPELEAEREPLSALDRAHERIMLGLRTARGVDLDAMQRELSIDLLVLRAAPIEKRRARGELVIEDGHLRIPHAHWLKLDAIVVDLF